VADTKFGWLISAAGITGTFAALGYVVRAAQEDLLGVSTYDPNRAGYFLAAGDFIRQTVFLLLNWPTLVAVCLTSLIISVLEIGRRRTRFVQERQSLLAIALVIACSAHLAVFVLPTGPINNVLFSSVCLKDRIFEIPSLMAGRTQTVWTNVVCSRTVKEIVPGCGGRAPEEYTSDLRDTYVWAVLSALLLWMTGWRILGLSKPGAAVPLKWWSIIPSDWSRALLIVSLITISFGISYLYGKTIRSTEFPVVAVDFAKDSVVAGRNGVGAPMAKRNSSSQQLTEESATEAMSTKTGEAPRKFYMLSDNGQTTVLYEPKNDVTWFVRNSAITAERMSSTYDLVRERISFAADKCSQKEPVQ
jgi:hypothetical protein